LKIERDNLAAQNALEQNMGNQFYAQCKKQNKE
jgi:hypothetical protein